MIKKQLDGFFCMKIAISVIGIIFLLSFIRIKWNYMPSEDEDGNMKNLPEKKTKPNKPLRMQIMSFNTITLFFLLLSIQEYRVNEVISPFGVDPEKIPPDCKIEQSIYYFTTMACCLIIVGYNYFIVDSALKNATPRNLFVKPKEQTSVQRPTYYGLSYMKPERANHKDRIGSESVDSINRRLKELKSLNGGFLAEIYPSAVEFMFFVLVAIFSIVMYLLLVLSNYGILPGNMFKSCAHPLNNNRFYDPFAEEDIH